MLVSLIGTNGLLSSSIGWFCNQKGYKLNTYGRSKSKYHMYDNFTEIDLLKEMLDIKKIAESDVIIYAAGAGIQFHLNENPDEVYKLNVSIPVQLCNSLKRTGFKGVFITFGSYFEIGENVFDKFFTETDLLQSQLKAPNDYIISKRMLSRYFSSFQAKFTFLHFILPTIYGETESNYRLIPYTLKSITENRDLSLTSGEQVRQYIYIHDVANILFNSINLTSGIYNVGGVEEFSVRQLVTKLFEFSNKDIPENIFGKAERVDTGMKILKLDGTKLSKSINYEATTKIAEVYYKYLNQGI